MGDENKESKATGLGGGGKVKNQRQSENPSARRTGRQPKWCHKAHNDRPRGITTAVLFPVRQGFSQPQRPHCLWVTQSRIQLLPVILPQGQSGPCAQLTRVKLITQTKHFIVMFVIFIAQKYVSIQICSYTTHAGHNDPTTSVLWNTPITHRRSRVLTKGQEQTGHGLPVRGLVFGTHTTYNVVLCQTTYIRKCCTD
jgi:hypothetical protein